MLKRSAISPSTFGRYSAATRHALSGLHSDQLAGCPAYKGGGLKEQTIAGLHCLTVLRSSCKEIFITATPVEGESCQRIFEKVAEALRDTGAQPVAQDVFGAPTMGQDRRQLLEDAFGEVNWPVTWLSENCTVPTGVTGTYVWAVIGPRVAPLEVEGTVVGSFFEDDLAQYCRLSGVVPTDPSAQPAEQTREVFERMAAALHTVDMNFEQVVRTWFYNDNILSWYDEFNRARDAFFCENGALSTNPPASTGMGGGNAVGAALEAGLLAVHPRSNSLRMLEVPSPLQCPAPAYGSSFSRAAELLAPDHRRVFVSGTASIDAEGNTLYVGDTRAQVAHTMDVVNAILASRDMTWEHVTRTAVYFKHGEDIDLFEAYCTEHGLPPLPAIYFVNDVCRADLLFEIEMDTMLVF